MDNEQQARQGQPFPDHIDTELVLAESSTECSLLRHPACKEHPHPRSAVLAYTTSISWLRFKPYHPISCLRHSTRCLILHPVVKILWLCDWRHNACCTSWNSVSLLYTSLGMLLELLDLDYYPKVYSTNFITVPYPPQADQQTRLM
jgi:hypothetical protein